MNFVFHVVFSGHLSLYSCFSYGSEVFCPADFQSLINFFTEVRIARCGPDIVMA